MSKSRTLPSKQKAHVLRAYRSRGRANRNIWLVYSLKTNRDWILRSDRHLVHWVLYLETNPRVRSFEIEPEEDLRVGVGNKADPAVDATVLLADGKHEYHRLMLTESNDSQACSATNDIHYASDGIFRIISETDLSSRGGEAMRWLKVLCYCAAIREERQSEATLAAITIMQGLGRGTVFDVLNLMQDFDSQVALGVLSRMAVLGDIALDLTSAGFTLSSAWAWGATR
jgi:hypothetical protein